jgi:hypothetical protein
MNPSLIDRPAPPWQVSQWFNTHEPCSLAALRGRVVVLEAFQMLCPGCVSHGLPQVQRVQQLFPADRVSVVGLHSVFEHHGAMTPVSLQAFLHEYRITFPVGVDVADTRGPVPLTMRAYALRGTPTLTLIDARGIVRQQHFGQVPDLLLGAQIAHLLHDAEHASADAAFDAHADAVCDDDGCALPPEDDGGR